MSKQNQESTFGVYCPHLLLPEESRDGHPRCTLDFHPRQIFLAPNGDIVPKAGICRISGSICLRRIKRYSPDQPEYVSLSDYLR